MWCYLIYQGRSAEHQRTNLFACICNALRRMPCTLKEQPLTFTELLEFFALMGTRIWNTLPTTAEESGKPPGCITAATATSASCRSDSTAECIDASSCLTSPRTSFGFWSQEAPTSITVRTITISSTRRFLSLCPSMGHPPSWNSLSLLRMPAFIFSRSHKRGRPVEGAACTPLSPKEVILFSKTQSSPFVPVAGPFSLLLWKCPQ